jgi:hypothetical protein
MAKQQTREAVSSPVGRSPLETVVVHGSDISVHRAHSELPLAEARARFGGLDVPAILGGALAGLGTAALLGGIVSAIGLEVGQGDAETLALAGLATALLVVALSALMAGWVAGRVARFDGARNGLLAGLLMSLLLALMGAAGAYSAADGGLPGLARQRAPDRRRPYRRAVAAPSGGARSQSLLGGGRVGARWHRRRGRASSGRHPPRRGRDRA